MDKFHTLLYYEEHEHVRVLKERLNICCIVAIWYFNVMLTAKMYVLSLQM